MDDQELHDLQLAQLDLKALSKSGSHQRLKAALRKPRPRDPHYGSDPIEMAIRNHPGLTREKALEDAAAKVGF
jgi:hypothetical protein